MKAVWILCSIATAFWFVMFSPLITTEIPFWLVMFAAVGILAISALILDHKEIAHRFSFKPAYLVIGPAAAVLLYIIFFLGKIISTKILPFADSQIADIYTTRQQANTIVIALLLVLWIGPGEEIFWRFFVQHRLANRFGPLKAYLLASFVYTIVHIFSFNLLLIAASAVCGLFWGFLYHRYKSIYPSLISHALWDILIFVILPVSEL